MALKKYVTIVIITITVIINKKHLNSETLFASSLTSNSFVFTGQEINIWMRASTAAPLKLHDGLHFGMVKGKTSQQKTGPLQGNYRTRA